MAKFTATFFVLCVGFLCLEVALACNCKVKHPQTQYKEAKFVVKAKVLSKYRNQEEQSSYAISFLEYEVQIIKIFKGRRILTSPTVSMFTPEGHSCAIKSMKPSKNYLISGHIEEGRLTLNVCSWVEEWSTLTKEQKKGLKSKYATYCKKCDVPSVSGPELVMALIDPRAPRPIETEPKLVSLSGLWTSEPGSCTFNPVDSWQFPTMDCETKYTYCSDNARDNCGWEINNKYKDCFVDRETAWAKKEIRRVTVEGRSGFRFEGGWFSCLSVEDAEFDDCVRDEVEKFVTRYL